MLVVNSDKITEKNEKKNKHTDSIVNTSMKRLWKFYCHQIELHIYEGIYNNTGTNLHCGIYLLFHIFVSLKYELHTTIDNDLVCLIWFVFYIYASLMLLEIY